MRALLIALALGPTLAVAEPAFVSDSVEVELRADVDPNSTAVKKLEGGAPLQVLERVGENMRVRDAQGVEGWLDVRHVSAQPAARDQVRALKTELERTRAQVVQLQTQLDRARTAPPAESEKTSAEAGALRAELARAQAALAAAQARAQAAERAQPGDAASGQSGGEFSFLWLAISFAMLLVGLIGGRVWVRESIRRRMGGMYLRI